MRRLTRLIAIVATILLPLLRAPVYAATGSIYLSPANKSIANGASFSVAVRMSSSDSVNAVQANLSYPTDKLDYVSTSFSGSTFEVQAQSTGGGGSVQIARGTVTPVSGDKLIATVTFRAKVASGSGVISVAASSTLANNGAEVPSTKGSATITFSQPVAAPAPPPAPPADKTPPVIASVAIAALSTTSATVTWATNEPADSGISYGLNTTYGIDISSAEKTTKHAILLNSSFIVPKTTYHFRVTSTDAAGNKQVGTDQTFTTKGIPVAITVRDPANKPLAGASLSASGTRAITDKDGRAVLELGTGNTTITATLKDASTTTSITLTPQDSAKTDTVIALRLTAHRSTTWTASIAPILFIIGLVIGLAIRRRRSPVLHIARHGSVHKSHANLKVSDLEKRYGVKDPENNPYVPHKWFYGYIAACRRFTKETINRLIAGR